MAQVLGFMFCGRLLSAFSGKTTTMSILTGLFPPTSGDAILWFDCLFLFMPPFSWF
jgi:hypothetical protein